MGRVTETGCPRVFQERASSGGGGGAGREERACRHGKGAGKIEDLLIEVMAESLKRHISTIEVAVGSATSRNEQARTGANRREEKKSLIDSTRRIFTRQECTLNDGRKASKRKDDQARIARM